MPQTSLSLLQRYNDPINKAPGCAAIVLHKGKIALEYYCGHANIEHAVPIDKNSRFLLASVSKMFTALLTGMLIRQGKFNLHTPVAYILGIKIPENITIYHLLTMTSGLRDSFELLTLAGLGRWTEHSIHDHLNLIQKCQSTDFDAGTDMLYTNINYILLGAIIEKITQTSYEQAIRDYILIPLGMHDTSFANSSADIIPSCADSYVPLYTEPATYQRGGALSPRMGLGSIVSTARDLALFSKITLENNFNGFPVLDFLNQYPLLKNDVQSHYGLGCMRTYYKGIDIISHTGGYCGCSSLLSIMPSHDMAVILLSNDDAFDRLTLTQHFIDHYLKNDLVTPESDTAWTHETLPLLCGAYINPENGEWANIEWNGKDIQLYHFLSCYTLNMRPSSPDQLIHDWGISRVSVMLPSIVEPPNEITLHINGATNRFIRSEDAERPSARLTDYIGRYQNEETGCAHEIYLNNNTLMLRLGHIHQDNLTFPLIPTIKDCFLAEGGPRGWGHSYIISFEREPHSKMLRGYRISSHRMKNFEMRRLQLF